MLRPPLRGYAKVPINLLSAVNTIFYLLLKPKFVFLPIKNTIATTTSPIYPKDKYGDKPKAVGIS